METGSPIAALNFPLKRIQSAHLVPPGAVDSTGAVANLPNKIASYQVWAMHMKAQYSGVTILESVNGMDSIVNHQLAVYPLK